MRIPLIVDEKDEKWKLIGEVCNLVESRRFHEEMGKIRFRPIPKGENVIKVVLVAMFFAEEMSYVVSELEKRGELREFICMTYVPSPQYVSRFLSRFTPEQFLRLTSGFLGSLCRKRSSQTTLITDSTDIQIDLNWFRRKIKKKDLENKPYTWAYSPSKGYYIGYKMTLVVEYPHLRPVFFFFHRGSPYDATIFCNLLEELRKRRIMRIGDIIITDKGYCSYKNYRTAFSNYKVVPLIFPKDNMNLNKILSQSFPLELFQGPESREKEKQFFIQLLEKFENLLKEWKDYRPLRGRIEDIFKLLKDGFFKEKIHRYTEKSCHRFVACSVLLAGILLYIGFNSKEHLQALSES